MPDNVINIRLDFQGVDVGITQVKEFGKAGEDVVNTLNKATAPGGTGVSQFFINIPKEVGGATKALTEHAGSARNVSNAYRILNPILGQFGVHVGGLRGLGTLATHTIPGLAFAVGTTAAVAFAKFSDSVSKTRTILADLLKVSPTDAGRIFNEIAGSAERYGTVATTILPAVQALLHAIREQTSFKVVAPPGQSALIGDPTKEAERVAIFLKNLKAAGAGEAEATKLTNDFFSALDKNKAVLPSMLEQLQKYPGALNRLKEAYGRASLSDDAFAKSLGIAGDSIVHFLTVIDNLKTKVKILPDRKEVDDLSDAIDKFFPKLQTHLTQTTSGKEVSEFFGGIVNNFEGFIENTIDDIALLKKSLTEPFENLNETQKSWFATLVLANRSAWGTINLDTLQQIGNMKQEITTNDYNNAWEGFKVSAKNAWQEIQSWFGANPLRVPATIVGPSGEWQGGGGWFASGGQVFGPGTATSDSIWARLSNREYVQPVRSVDYYGVRFMEAIRTLRFPRELAIGNGSAFIPKTPRFAEGGQVNSNLRPFVMNVPGLGSFTGSIAAPDRVVDALSRRSVLEQSAAGGKAPIWRR